MPRYYLLQILIVSTLLGCTSQKVAEKKNELPPLQVVISDLKRAKFAPADRAYDVKVEITNLHWPQVLYNPFFFYMTDVPARFEFIDSHGNKYPGYVDITGSHRPPARGDWIFAPIGTSFGRRMVVMGDFTKMKYPIRMKLLLFEEMKMETPMNETEFNRMAYKYNTGQANKVVWIESNELIIR